jgi:hypothetical protein
MCPVAQDKIKLAIVTFLKHPMENKQLNIPGLLQLHSFKFLASSCQEQNITKFLFFHNLCSKNYCKYLKRAKTSEPKFKIISLHALFSS